MTPQQIELVKATVPVLRENGVALTGYFYNRMLGNNPNLKETFNMGHQRSGAQAQALAGAVLAYAENIEDPSVLLPVVELIAHKHVSLNIQAPDYNIVGENLLHSISEVLSISMEDPLLMLGLQRMVNWLIYSLALKKRFMSNINKPKGAG